jgi:hypothetical protein
MQLLLKYMKWLYDRMAMATPPRVCTAFKIPSCIECLGSLTSLSSPFHVSIPTARGSLNWALPRSTKEPIISLTCWVFHFRGLGFYGLNFTRLCTGCILKTYLFNSCVVLFRVIDCVMVFIADNSNFVCFVRVRGVWNRDLFVGWLAF